MNKLINFLKLFTNCRLTLYGTLYTLVWQWTCATYMGLRNASWCFSRGLPSRRSLLYLLYPRLREALALSEYNILFSIVRDSPSFSSTYEDLIDVHTYSSGVLGISDVSPKGKWICTWSYNLVPRKEFFYCFDNFRKSEANSGNYGNF